MSVTDSISYSVGVNSKLVDLQFHTAPLSGVSQRRTEEGVKVGGGGLEPLPSVYVNVSESVIIWYFQEKIRKIFWERDTAPFPDPSPSGEGDTPSPPPSACDTSTPPILKSWVRHWHLCFVHPVAKTCTTAQYV